LSLLLKEEGSRYLQKVAVLCHAIHDSNLHNLKRLYNNHSTPTVPVIDLSGTQIGPGCTRKASGWCNKLWSFWL